MHSMLRMVRLNGNNLLMEQHKDFSVVFQNVVLFNNTVMENIRIGRKDATDEDVPLTEVLLQRAEHMMN